MSEKEVKIIKAVNPNADEQKALIESISTETITGKVEEFKFRKAVDKDTGEESLREPLLLILPYLNVNGIVAAIEAGGKQLELILDSVNAVIQAEARDLISDDTEVNASTIDLSKLSWEVIANKPKAQRGGGIPKEVWDAFIVDYNAVMPEATGKSVEQVSTASNLMKGKFVLVRTNKKVLNVLVQQLAIYSEATASMETFAPCVEFLLAKAETFLSASDEDLLANL